MAKYGAGAWQVCLRSWQGDSTSSGLPMRTIRSEPAARRLFLRSATASKMNLGAQHTACLSPRGKLSELRFHSMHIASAAASPRTCSACSMWQSALSSVGPSGVTGGLAAWGGASAAKLARVEAEHGQQGRSLPVGRCQRLIVVHAQVAAEPHDCSQNWNLLALSPTSQKDIPIITLASGVFAVPASCAIS